MSMNFLDNKKLILENVELYSSKNLIKIKIISKEEILFNEDILQITNYLENDFPGLDIEIDIKYKIENITDSDLFYLYRDRLIEIIINKYPSANTWIENTIMKFEQHTLFIYPPDDLSYKRLKNGFKEFITETIKEELDLEIKILVDEDNIKRNESFLDDKLNEVKIIAEEQEKNRVINFPKNTIKKSKDKNFIYGKTIKGESISLDELDITHSNVIVEGDIFEIEKTVIRNGRIILSLSITDYTNSVKAKMFIDEKTAEDILNNIDEKTSIKVQGNYRYDDYDNDFLIWINSINIITKKYRTDESKEKRVELHLHTKMSLLEGVVDIDELMETLNRWGHKSIAITDTGAVQAFPLLMNSAKKHGIKVLYGMEGYFIDDTKKIITNIDNKEVLDTYTVFDLETTGLSAINDKIIEIGAVKIKNGNITETFSKLINPEREISDFITDLTGISNDMVKDSPTIKEVIKEFYDFIKDSVLVAHNANFDMGFIRENLKIIDIDNLDNPVLDTLQLARAVFPDLKNHRLDTLTKYLSVELESHHRALDDAYATGEVFLKTLEASDLDSKLNISDLDRLADKTDNLKDRPFHITLLAKNLRGLKNLYKLVSISHLEYFYRKPRILKSILKENREGLLIGSACSQGEIFEGILANKNDKELNDLVKFYDYLEIQPAINNQSMVDRAILKDLEQIESINKKIYELGKRNNILVVATGDVYYLNPEDNIYTEILTSAQAFVNNDRSNLYLKTTEEMLEEFSYLGRDIAREVVIENTQYISNLIEKFDPIPSGTFPPIIEGSDEELREMTYKKAREIYGEKLPKIVEDRLEKELNSVIDNNYSVMYIISEKLVSQSINDGYLVGSRGSVGSSFAATMAGITEVNPLAPHYICPNCKYNEFFTNNEVYSGVDLEDKNCPKCNSELLKEGHNIPFEVFLGFDGDKEPDIDLNFAGEYQAKAHKYVEDMFGDDHVFRAGTIGTIANRTAYGYVKKYFEEIEKPVRPVEVERLLRGITGVKRTTGQHPGGVMIVPDYKDILDFSPIQYPANRADSGVITTHFDYDAISENILKLDILGHDVPTIIKMLEDMTGVNPLDIPLDEKETMRLFSSTESLGVSEESIKCKVGTLGIPEFGTRFVRQMLTETQPNTFSDLVRISGLSHGTDVWLNNAQDLIRDGIVTLNKTISTREDIMLNLISQGMKESKAFNIMENVRKGRGLKPEEESEMRELGVEDWYIKSCKTIKYMFPKAHAVAYVMMSFRIAYYKVYYPEAFYATYFTTKVADFDSDIITPGLDSVEREIKNIEQMANNKSQKDEDRLNVLEVAREMYNRDIKIKKVCLYNSDSHKFIIEDNSILPPLRTLEGLGDNAARMIVKERDKEFISKEDISRRTGLSKKAIEVLTNHGCLDGIPDSDQLDLFSI